MRDVPPPRRLSLLALALLAAGCGREIDPGRGDAPLAEFSANVSAGDLLDPATADARVARYLDELTAAGYKKQVRIILPPDWGPRIYEHWFPAIRARGFKVVAILGQERRDSADDAPAAVAWVEHILPLVRSDLIGVEIVNEPAWWFTPEDYAVYHRRIAPRVRKLAPGVPIVAVVDGVVVAGADDYDILGVHVTGVTRKSELNDFADRLSPFCAGGRRVWITEGDWGQRQYLRGRGVPVEEAFLYSWNDDATPALIRRPGGRLP